MSCLYCSRQLRPAVASATMRAGLSARIRNSEPLSRLRILFIVLQTVFFSMDDLPNALRNLESYEPLESELSDAQKQKSRLEAYAEIRHGFKLILASNAVYIDEMERLQSVCARIKSGSNAFEKQYRFYATYAHEQQLNEQALKAEISKNISLTSQLVQSQCQLRQAQQIIQSLERCRSLRSNTKQSS